MINLFFATLAFANPSVFDNVIDNGLTASRACVSDSNKQLASSATTLTELGYVSGVTSSIQTQLNAKQASLTTGTTSQYFKGDLSLGTFATDALALFSATAPIVDTSGVFSCVVATGSVPGCLAAADFTTFAAKQATISIGAFSSTPSTNGLTLSGSAINLDPADGTHPGGMSTGTQTIAGTKTFTAPVVGTQAIGDNSTTAASTAFVQTMLAQINPPIAVYAASTANIPGTYTNAVGGVCIADTFLVTALTLFTTDGASPPLNSRVLLKDQSSSFQDGVWTLTTQGVVGVTGAILTRANDDDSAADMNAGTIIGIQNGSTLAGQSWWRTNAAITTCNSNTQTWSRFQRATGDYALGATTISAGTGLTGGGDLSTNRTLTLANPSASTLGGVESLAVVTSKWINTISTSGVPAATQPAFTDISGTATVAQTTVANQALTTCTTARTLDWTTGNSFTLTLTSGNACTLTFSGAVSGQTITIWLTNGSAGGTATVVWPTAKWFPAGAPVMTTGTGALDVCTVTYNGTSYAANCLQNGG